MKKEELAQFIEWLPKNVEAFADKKPEEIAEALNDMASSDEGQEELKGLINEFKNKTGMFREGGKLDFLLKKFQQGGVYDREAARSNKADANLWYTDENGNEYRSTDNGNLASKIAKAKAVKRFADANFIDNFDRKAYREKKRELKLNHPELSRRERKAMALLAPKTVTPAVISDVPVLNIAPEMYQRRGEAKGIVEVGGPEAIGMTTYRTVRTPVYETRTIRVQRPTEPRAVEPMGWNQFGTYGAKHLKDTHAFRGDVDLNTMQAYLEKEYDRYRQDPENYVWQDPGQNDNLLVGRNWKSKYGAFNTNPNNWGNDDRSGELGFNGKANLSRSFADSNISAAGQQIMKSAAKIGAAGAAGAVGGGLIGAGLGMAAGGALNGDYSQFYQDKFMQEHHVPQNWQTQPRQYGYKPGGAGGGITYKPNGRFGHPVPGERIVRFTSPNTYGMPQAGKEIVGEGATQAERMSLLNRVLNGNAIGTALIGGNQAFNEYDVMNQPRSGYTSFNPSYR